MTKEQSGIANSVPAPVSEELTLTADRIAQRFLARPLQREEFVTQSSNVRFSQRVCSV